MWVWAVLVLVLFGLLWLWIWLLNRRSNAYFKKLGVPFIDAPILGGHLKEIILQRKAITDVLLELYNDPKTKSEPIVGIRFLHFHGLFVRDLDLLKKILVKDFHIFSDRRTYSDIHSDVLGGSNIFMLKNPAWKEVRAKITPVFTGNKMRQLFLLVKEVGEDMNRYLEQNIPVEREMDVKEIAALYATDVIATCAYGIQANSLKDPKSSFRRHGKKIFDFNTLRSIELALMFFWPETGPWLRLKQFGRESTRFLTDTLLGVMNEREKNDIVRSDLIDILLKLRNKNGDLSGVDLDGVNFDDSMLVAQAAVFFTAGFETTSSAIGFTLYELAKQPELQQRLRREIKDFLEANNNNITYENIRQLTYLNMCCQETFRMYPTLAFIDRECRLEAGQDSYSLEPISNFKVPNGFPIYIPTYALHHDEQYFPNAFTFDPERFSDEKKGSIPPYAYIPFGAGPRDCMGKRFGIISVTMGLINFLKDHSVEVCSKTQLTVEMNRKAMMLIPKQGLILRVRKDVGAS